MDLLRKSTAKNLRKGAFAQNDLITLIERNKHFRLEESFADKLPHLYTLILRPDNTFEIQLDRKVVKSGSLLEDFTPAVNPPAEIEDPEDKKPEDWDEREKIPDPTAVKPEGWDEDAPAQIVDESQTIPNG